MVNTGDGRNPAPVDMVNIVLLFTGFLPSTVVYYNRYITG